MKMKRIQKLLMEIRKIYPDFIFTSLGVTSTDGSNGITLLSLDSDLVKNYQLSAFSTMLTILINNAEKTVEGFDFKDFILNYNHATSKLNKERK